MTASAHADVAFHERLWPAPWVFLSTALVIPAAILVFLPINLTLGFISAAVLEIAVLVVLFATTPVVEVGGGMLRAGRAHIPLTLVSSATASTGKEAFDERGVRLDARAWLLIRGWIPGVVRVDLADADDPTPYWLVSSRREDELAAAINAG